MPKFKVGDVVKASYDRTPYEIVFVGESCYMLRYKIADGVLREVALLITNVDHDYQKQKKVHRRYGLAIRRDRDVHFSGPYWTNKTEFEKAFPKGKRYYGDGVIIGYYEMEWEGEPDETVS